MHTVVFHAPGGGTPVPPPAPRAPIVEPAVSAQEAPRSDARHPPTARARRLIGLGIAAYLICQVALPLRYYLGENRRDERFAWRIFSALAIAPYQCDVHVQEFGADERVGRTVDLSRVLHDAWIVALRQGQDAVVDRFLHARCASSALVQAVEFSRICQRSDRRPAPFMRVRLDCRSGARTTHEEMR